MESGKTGPCCAAKNKNAGVACETGFLNSAKIISFMMKKMLRSRRLAQGVLGHSGSAAG